MILVDANLLIYARFPALPQHRDAKLWLEESLNGDSRIGLPWASLLAYLRISTNRRAFQSADTVGTAWKLVEEWLNSPNVWVPAPGDNHAGILARTIVESGGADRVPDAHLAALAIEHGLTLCSTDRDFARFRGLKWHNPLANEPSR